MVSGEGWGMGDAASEDLLWTLGWRRDGGGGTEEAEHCDENQGADDEYEDERRGGRVLKGGQCVGGGTSFQNTLIAFLELKSGRWGRPVPHGGHPVHPQPDVGLGIRADPLPTPPYKLCAYKLC